MIRFKVLVSQLLAGVLLAWGGWTLLCRGRGDGSLPAAGRRAATGTMIPAVAVGFGMLAIVASFLVEALALRAWGLSGG